MVGYITLEDQLHNCPTVRKEDVKAVLEWAKKQPHLPNFDKVSERIAVMIAMTIKRRYNSIERAKETIDNMLTFKTLVPEMYANRTLSSPDVKTYFSSTYDMVMDQRDSAGNIVFVHSIHDPDPNKYDFNATVKGIFMVIESWCWENGCGGAPGITIIFDQTNFSLSHLGRVPISGIKKLNYLAEKCIPLSVKNVVIVNATNIIQTVLSVFQPFVYGELFKQIKMFSPSQMDELYKFVPKEALPNEYGGTGGAMAELMRISLKRIERQEQLNKTLDALKVDESKRTGPQKNVNTLFGLEGSFKKLNVD